ncbi:hypothetical protein ES703_31228 [subsurface metagenome]
MKGMRKMGLNLFRKKEKIERPYHYGEIVFTREAASEGVFDMYQKEIHIIKNGILVEKIPYTMADVEALKKVYSIPIKDLTKGDMEEEDFEFGQIFSLSGTVSEIKKI